MADLEKLGAITLKMDVTNEVDVRAVVSTIELNHGGVDILINNAGFGMYGAVEDTSIDDARYQFEVNLFGLAHLTKLVLPYMRNKRAGKIINISSMGGKVYTPLGGWYHATKHALEGWSDCLRIEVAQFGIDVVIIEPGLIGTEFGDVLMEPMIQRSGKGPYHQVVDSLAQATTESYSGNNYSDPGVITKLVIKAVKARKPKTRYFAGKYAKPMMFARKWFGDRIYDRMVMSMVK